VIPGEIAPARARGARAGLESRLHLSLRQTTRHRLLEVACRACGLYEHADRVERCGTWHVVYECVDCGRKVRRYFRCGDRLCPECARARADRLFREYAAECARPGLKHLVLTVPSTRHITRQTYAKLREQFTRLRHRKRFAAAWRGGFYSIEATYSPRYGWHIHIHVLLEGDYVPQAEIAAAWREETGGAEVVWIGAARNPRQVFKYILKPDDAVLRNPRLFGELVDAVKGSRLAQPFGTWSGNHRAEDAGDDGGEYDEGLRHADERLCSGAGGMVCPYCGSKRMWSEYWPADADVSGIPLLRRGDNGTGWILDG